jgi:DNA-binding NarL/FixJ family response regulator
VTHFLRAVMVRREAMHEEARATPGHTMPKCTQGRAEDPRDVPRAPSEPLTDAVVRLRRRGDSVVAIARRLGTTHTTVYRHLRLAGCVDGIRPYQRRKS